jgi:chromosome segregation ATPase
VHQLRAELGVLEKEMALGRAQIGDLAAAVDGKETELAALKGVRDQLAAQGEGQSQRVAALEAQVELLEGRHAAAEALEQSQHDELQARLVSLQAAAVAAEEESQARVGVLERAFAQKEAECAQLQAEVGMKNDDIASLQEVQDSLQREAREAERRVVVAVTTAAQGGEALAAALGARTAELAALQESLDAKDAEVAELAKEMDTLEALHAEKGEEIACLVESNSALQQQVLTLETSLEESNGLLHRVREEQQQGSAAAAAAAGQRAAALEAQLGDLAARLERKDGELAAALLRDAHASASAARWEEEQSEEVRALRAQRAELQHRLQVESETRQKVECALRQQQQQERRLVEEAEAAAEAAANASSQRREAGHLRQRVEELESLVDDKVGEIGRLQSADEQMQQRLLSLEADLEEKESLVSGERRSKAAFEKTVHALKQQAQDRIRALEGQVHALQQAAAAARDHDRAATTTATATATPPDSVNTELERQLHSAKRRIEHLESVKLTEEQVKKLRKMKEERSEFMAKCSALEKEKKELEQQLQGMMPPLRRSSRHSGGGGSGLSEADRAKLVKEQEALKSQVQELQTLNHMLQSEKVREREREREEGQAFLRSQG